VVIPGRLGLELVYGIPDRVTGCAGPGIQADLRPGAAKAPEGLDILGITDRIFDPGEVQHGRVTQNRAYFLVIGVGHLLAQALETLQGLIDSLGRLGLPAHMGQQLLVAATALETLLGSLD
jgi:hypothetical protein